MRQVTKEDKFHAKHWVTCPACALTYYAQDDEKIDMHAAYCKEYYRQAAIDPGISDAEYRDLFKRWFPYRTLRLFLTELKENKEKLTGYEFTPDGSLLIDEDELDRFFKKHSINWIDVVTGWNDSKWLFTHMRPTCVAKCTHKTFLDYEVATCILIRSDALKFYDEDCIELFWLEEHKHWRRIDETFQIFSKQIT